jgi:hypothetical protein
MVRELKKPSKGLSGLEELEKDCDAEVETVHKQLEKDFKSELDAGFFFSVVFNTKEERDQWLQDHGLKLIEDMFIKASDFTV